MADTLTENVAMPVQSCRRLSKFALQLAMRVSAAAGCVVSLLVSACWSIDVGVGHDNWPCLVLELLLDACLDRSIETAERIDNGLTTSIMTSDTFKHEQ